MTAIDCHWNHNGTILAAAGCTNEQSNAVQFFSAYGEVSIKFLLLFAELTFYIDPSWIELFTINISVMYYYYL